MSRLKIISTSLLILLTAGLLSGCRHETSLHPAPGYVLDLIVQPSPAVVGHAHLELELTDPEDQPVQGASIAVRGDMTHPGMTPVLAEATELGGGRYTIALEWTMAGDWIVTFEVELPDGTIFERSVELNVSSMDGMDHDS
jgi:hypothetical protein